MRSDLSPFARMYLDARRRDCGLTYVVSATLQAFPEMPLLDAVAMYCRLRDAGDDFDDNMEATIRDVRTLYVDPDVQFVCPYCRNSNCPRARRILCDPMHGLLFQGGFGT